MKKGVLIWIVCILLILSQVLAQDIKYELKKEAPILEMYLYSWGLGETTEINLDNYFSVKRKSEEIYVSSAPSEISIYIDQVSGVAKLTPNADWVGTKRIIFMITNKDVSPLEAQEKIMEYVRQPDLLENKDILKQIEEKEFKNNTIEFDIIKKLLENMKNNLGPEAKVTVTKEKKLVKVDVGKNTELNVGFEEFIINNLRTEKPKITINVNPTGEGTEEVTESGLSIVLIIPIIFIVLSLLGIAGFYIKDHYSNQINKFFSKFKQRTKQIDVERANFIKIKKVMSEIENIQKIQNTQEASKQFFEIIKEFFKALIQTKFTETYSGLDKKIMLDSIDDSLKEEIIKFSKDISDIKFSGKEVDKNELKKLISKSKSLMSLVLAKKKGFLVKEQRKQKWFSKLITRLEQGKREIKGAKLEVEKAKKEIRKERFELPKIGIRKFLHDQIGLFKTQSEKIKEKIRKIKEEKKEDKEKDRKKRQEKIKEEKEKERLRKLKIREKEEKREKLKESWKRFWHNIGLYKTKEEILNIKHRKSLEIARIARQKQLEQEKKQREEAVEKARKARKKQLEQEKKREEKEEKRREKQREERRREGESREKALERKKTIRKFLHEHLGLYKSKSELEKIAKLEAVEKARKTREKHLKEDKKEEERRKNLREKHQKELIKKREEEREKRRKEFEREKRGEKLKEEKKIIRKFLHDKLGFHKTEKELIEERKIKAVEKARKARKKQFEEREEEREKRRNQHEEERKREEKEQKRREKQRERKIKSEERKKKIGEIKAKTKKFLKEKLRLFKTKEEKSKDFLKKEIRKIEQKRPKKTFKEFLHDKLGFFKTPEEKINDLEKIRQKRIERLKKLKRRFIIEEVEKLKTPDLKPEEKVKILEGELQKALRQGQTDRARRIDHELEKFYKKIPKKREHKIKLTFLTKLKDRIKEIKYKPEYRELKEKIIHPKKEHKEEEHRKIAIEELVKRTEESLEGGAKKEAEILYERTSGLLRGTSSRLKKILNREKEVIEKEKEEFEKTKRKIEEDVKDKFERLTTPTKKSSQPKNIKDNTNKIEKLIIDIKRTAKKDINKARALYEKASSEFKKIPEELPETTHERLYSQLKPLKNEILRQSIPNLLKELNKVLKENKIDKAKEIQEKIDDIYSYLAKQKEPSMLIPTSLIDMISKAESLISYNPERAKELYRKLMDRYNALPEREKKIYFRRISELYSRLTR